MIHVTLLSPKISNYHRPDNGRGHTANYPHATSYIDIVPEISTVPGWVVNNSKYKCKNPREKFIGNTCVEVGTDKH